MTRIAVSILSFYFEAKRKKESNIQMIEHINSAIKNRKFDILHLDIGDGRFIKSKTFTPSIINKLQCKKKRHTHLMVLDYNRYIKDYFHLSDMFIIHNEVLRHDFQKTINFLKKNNKNVGISINPDTHVDEIKYIEQVNLILVMSVYPGLPGQEFIEHSLRKIRKLKEIRKNKGLKFSIAVDGGINMQNIQKCIDAGADILVMGTGFFKDPHIEETIKEYDQIK
ncbi:MAG: ribulose-phosphate 3-epimerase [Candidatus Woesearchaeota archaeon]|nr:MAG: ribulose-phosphate 3-epimerase [Candidatus Woesearchaeota archaeon]